KYAEKRIAIRVILIKESFRWSEWPREAVLRDTWNLSGEGEHEPIPGSKLRPARRLRTKRARAISVFRRLGLTRREADVLLWIARGQSNAEIGASLRISAPTVKKHLEHIFDKLGVKTRLAAAVRAGAVCTVKPLL